MDSAFLAKELGKLGYYVSRHSNWLLVMRNNKIAATIYVYPDYKEVTVVDRDEVAELVAKILRDYKVLRKRPKFIE